MCGIGGVINANGAAIKLEEILTGLARDLHHRGPDDYGVLLAEYGRTGLVGTRLAIQDLSSAGHQPMTSEDGRYHITFNGEIYNFPALREELKRAGEVFASHSDTEVILKMYRRYGPDCVREFAGRFAIALWGEIDQSCFLARGPLGFRAIYYYAASGELVLCSEVCTLLDTGRLRPRLRRAALMG